jgi:hypothetical protein
MPKGFFIGISKFARNSSDKYWVANYIEPLSGWDSSRGKSFEEIIQSQKNQYHSKIESNHPVPGLVNECDSPMASGKITRFVEV